MGSDIWNWIVGLFPIWGWWFWAVTAFTLTGILTEEKIEKRRWERSDQKRR